MGGNLKDLKAESTFGFGYGGLGIDGYAGGGGGGYYGNGWNNNFGGGYGFRGNGGKYNHNYTSLLCNLRHR